MLQDSPEEQTKVATVESPVHYNPMTVLETLKLLSKGDISDDALEVYEKDGNRIRAYAAIAKQRTLTSEEQAMVDEIGTRLSSRRMYFRLKASAANSNRSRLFRRTS